MARRNRPQIPSIPNERGPQRESAYDRFVLGGEDLRAAQRPRRGSSTRRTSVPPIDLTPGRSGGAHDRFVLGGETPPGAVQPAQESVRRRQGPDISEAIELAEQGDYSTLLPYQPTPSINPPRPRTLMAGYDSGTQTLRIRFRNGQVYEYYGVPQNVWRNLRRAPSPGKFVNRVLNSYPYADAPNLNTPTGNH